MSAGANVTHPAICFTDNETLSGAANLVRRPRQFFNHPLIVSTLCPHMWFALATTTINEPRPDA